MEKFQVFGDLQDELTSQRTVRELCPEGFQLMQHGLKGCCSTLGSLLRAKGACWANQGALDVCEDTTMCPKTRQGVFRSHGSWGYTYGCRRPRGGPARPGRSCCHSGTRGLPGSPSGCARGTWHTAGPRGLTCKIPAGRLQRREGRGDGQGDVPG